MLNYFNPEVPFKNSQFEIKNRLKRLLNKLRGFKTYYRLSIKIKKTMNEDKTKHSTFYLNS